MKMKFKVKPWQAVTALFALLLLWFVARRYKVRYFFQNISGEGTISFVFKSSDAFALMKKLNGTEFEQSKVAALTTGSSFPQVIIDEIGSKYNNYTCLSIQMHSVSNYTMFYEELEKFFNQVKFYKFDFAFKGGLQ